MPNQKELKDYSHLIGVTNDRLTVVSVHRASVGKSKRTVGFVRCKCICGNLKDLSVGSFSRPIKMSCGCLKQKGGNPESRRLQPEYHVYNAMKQRCGNPNYKGYVYYGRRGIKVCDRWLQDYAFFIEDMGKRPSDKHTIDRINNDGNYCKENCRWVLIDVQALNKSSNITAMVNGEKISGIDAICEHLNLEPNSFRNLLNNHGMPPQKIVNKYLYI